MKRPLESVNQDAVPSADDPERRVLSRKELARAQRRAVYQRAKERRATDPRHLAMKEAAKEQRRAAYQQVKERRRTAAAAQKATRALPRSDDRMERDRELGKLVTCMAKGSTAKG
jgi:hypothetical protein